MNIDELREFLEESLPFRCQVDEDVNGQVIILTGMSQDEDGDLVKLESEEDEDFDPDFESFSDDDDD